MKRMAFFAVAACAVIAALTAGQGSAASGGTAPVYRNSGHDCAIGATDPFDPVGHFTASGRGATLYGPSNWTRWRPCRPIRSRSSKTIRARHVRRDIANRLHGFGTLTFHAPMVSSAGEDAFVLTSHNDHQLASGAVFLSG